MPPLRTTGDYRPTWKLSLADRHHAKYAHKVIDHIIRQENRPHKIRKRGMDKAKLITYWVEQDQAIKIGGKPELVADYTSIAGEDGLTPEEWVELSKKLKTATEKYSKKHKANVRKGTATKRKRTASEETRKTKRTKKNSDDSEGYNSKNDEGQEDTDMESEDRDLVPSDDDAKARRNTRRSRRGGRHSGFAGDASDTQDSVAATKRSRNASAASKEPARRHVAGRGDLDHKIVATKKTSVPHSMLPHPRSVRRVKGGVPGPYKRFKPVNSDSSGDSLGEFDDDLSASENDVVATRGFEHVSAAAMLNKPGKKGKEHTPKHKHEHKGYGSDLLRPPLPLSHNKQMRMLQEYTEEEDSDKPEYDK